MKCPRRRNAGLFFIPDQRGNCIAERCEQLYGRRPDGYMDEQLIAAERQLEDDGVIPARPRRSTEATARQRLTFAPDFCVENPRRSFNGLFLVRHCS